MGAKMLDVIMGVGVAFTTIALVAMLVDLASGGVPGESSIALLTLGIAGAVGALVRRFDQGAAQQVTLAEALLDARQRRAGAVLDEPVGAGASAPPVPRERTEHCGTP